MRSAAEGAAPSIGSGAHLRPSSSEAARRICGLASVAVDFLSRWPAVSAATSVSDKAYLSRVLLEFRIFHHAQLASPIKPTSLDSPQPQGADRGLEATVLLSIVFDVQFSIIMTCGFVKCLLCTCALSKCCAWATLCSEDNALSESSTCIASWVRTLTVAARGQHYATTAAPT